MTSDRTADEQAIAAVVAVFFDAFTSGPGLADRMTALRATFLPGATIVRTCGEEPLLMDVEQFVVPREALLSGDRVGDFREWETEGRTEVYGAIAHHWCRYAKSWTEGGEPRSGTGAKTVQLVRTADGWRIAAVAWDDDPA